MQTGLQRSGCGALTTTRPREGPLLACKRLNAAPVRVRRGVTVHARAPVEQATAPQIVPSLPESPQQQSAAPSWSFPEKVSNFLRSTAKAAAVLGVAVALVSGCGDRLVPLVARTTYLNSKKRLRQLSLLVRSSMHMTCCNAV